jgi:glycosyltransferase involved in cell wall biosynthesis
MKALYLTLKPIYPTVDGGCVAMASFLNHLLVLYEKVDHLAIETHKHPFNASKYPIISKEKLTIDAVYVNTKIQIIPSFLNLFSSNSYNISRFYSIEFEKKLKQLFTDNIYEVIYIESIYLLPYLKSIRNSTASKVILRTPNIEYQIWEKHKENSKKLVKKWYLGLLTKKLKHFELNHYNLVDGILTITETDAEFLKKNGITKPIHYVPFSIKSQPISQLNKDSLFFIGALNWKPNLDTVLYLINILFPKIKKSFPTIKLHIAGSYTPDFLYQYQSDSIILHGKVNSIFEFMKKHGLLISPIFSGSGVRIKILEALSIGIPVIGSKIALQGIQSEACFIAEKEDEYITILKTLLSSNLTEIQQKAIEFIDNNFNPINIEKSLDEFVTSC